MKLSLPFFPIHPPSLTATTLHDTNANNLPHSHSPSLSLSLSGEMRSAPFELLESGVLNTSHPQHPDLWYSKLTHVDNPCPRLGKYLYVLRKTLSLTLDSTFMIIIFHYLLIFLFSFLLFFSTSVFFCLSEWMRAFSFLFFNFCTGLFFFFSRSFKYRLEIKKYF